MYQYYKQENIIENKKILLINIIIIVIIIIIIIIYNVCYLNIINLTQQMQNTPITMPRVFAALCSLGRRLNL